ncbi:SulP family inorganic anion transporter [Fusibacter sp. JL298sf-3]
MNHFKPKLLTTLKTYDKAQFLKDLTAGLIVAIVALPLSIALAIASGVSPEKGLHTAIIAGFLISLLGGSRVQIGGPTGAFMVIVYGIVMTHGVDGLIMATVMGGFFMFLMGLFKLGSVIKFIPHTITTGFTAGIAVTIFSSQINDFFGMNLTDVPAAFLDKWQLYAAHVSAIHWPTVAIGAVALAIIVFWPKTKLKIPGTLVALIVATAITQLFALDIMTIGGKFGELSKSLPAPQLPAFSMEKMSALLAPAMTIAVLGAVESLLSAVVADGMIGGKHRSNTELMAQGVANMASGLFGGIPATGAIARTVTNIKSGGRTPVAGMIHAVVLLLIMLLFMPLAQMIPLTALAAVLMVVAYNMSEWRECAALMKSPKSDILVLTATFLITVFVDLVVAIEVGMVLAAMLFMKRMAEESCVREMTRDTAEEAEHFTPAFDVEVMNALPTGVQMYEINGPMFFGVADKFLEVLNSIDSETEVIILRLRNVPCVDATAIHSMKRFITLCKNKGIQLLVTGIQPQPYTSFEKAGLIEAIGKEHFYEKFETALERTAGIND